MCTVAKNAIVLGVILNIRIDFCCIILKNWHIIPLLLAHILNQSPMLLSHTTRNTCQNLKLKHESCKYPSRESKNLDSEISSGGRSCTALNCSRFLARMFALSVGMVVLKLDGLSCLHVDSSPFLVQNNRSGTE